MVLRLRLLQLPCYQVRYFYTVSQKVPTLKLSVTFQILTDFQNFCTAGSYAITHLTLGMLLHYFEKIKSQISVDLDENANKLHFGFTAFNSSMRVTVHAECIYVIVKYSKY